MNEVVGSFGHCTDLSASIAVRQSAAVSDSWQSRGESLRAGILGRKWTWHQAEGSSGSQQRLACKSQLQRYERLSFAAGYVSPAPTSVIGGGERQVVRHEPGPEGAATAATTAVRAVAAGSRARATGSGLAARLRAATAACRSQRGLLGSNCEWIKEALTMLS